MAPKNNKRHLNKRVISKNTKASTLTNVIEEQSAVNNELYQNEFGIDLEASSETESVNNDLCDEPESKELKEIFPKLSTIFVPTLVPTIEKTSSVNNALTNFEILTKTLSLMNSETVNFDSIFQKIFVILEIPKPVKRELCLFIINTFLEMTIDHGKLELDALSKTFAELLLPEELTKITINENKLKNKVYVDEGGYGVISRGILRQSDGSNLKVVVKSSVSENKVRFLRKEAITMSQLDHENIVKILGFVEKPMQIVMEDLEFGDLREYVLLNDVPRNKLCSMITDVICGLEYLANKRYIHRDLNAGNIFVNSNLKCKIGDFGFCCYVDDPNGFYKEKGVIDSYFVEWKVKVSQKFTLKSDVWALGLLIWELCYLKDVRFSFAPKTLLRHTYEIFKRTNSLPAPKHYPKRLFKYIIKYLMHPDSQKRPIYADIKKVVAECF